jgi:plastocyanin
MMMKNLTISAAILLVVSAVLFGCMGQSSTSTTTTTVPTGPTAEVSIAGFAFTPSALTISAETTVIWTNNDSVTHTVTSTSGPVSFESGAIASGGTYSFKFSSIGTYTYKCSIHATMTGSVIVQ